MLNAVINRQTSQNEWKRLLMKLYKSNHQNCAQNGKHYNMHMHETLLWKRVTLKYLQTCCRIFPSKSTSCSVSRDLPTAILCSDLFMESLWESSGQCWVVRLVSSDTLGGLKGLLEIRSSISNIILSNISASISLPVALPLVIFKTIRTASRACKTMTKILYY